MFNFGIYKESLRRTYILGTLFSVILGIFALIPPLFFHLTNNERSNWHPGMTDITVNHFIPLMFIAIFIMLPFIAWNMFSFLNSRHSSDFYHALAYKRETIFVSMNAAVLTWSIGAMVVSTLISAFVYAVSPFAILNWISVFVGLTGFLAIGLLILGGITLASSFTGTITSNITTALLILIGPRLVMMVFIQMIIAGGNMVRATHFGIFGNHRLNLIFGFFSGNTFGLPTAFTSMILQGLLYTTVLAGIYLVLAGYLFKKRHSETATHSGTRLSQAITRVSLAFLVTIPSMLTILSPHNSDSSVALVVVYVIAIFIYFAYEVVTTRKLSVARNVAAGLIIVVLLNFFFIWGVNFGRNRLLREVNPDTVRSVQIANFNHSHWHVYDSYAIVRLSGYQISDEEIAQGIIAEFNNQVDRNRRALTSVDGFIWNGPAIEMTFEFENGRSITRLFHDDRMFVRQYLEPYLLSSTTYLESFLLIPADFDRISSFPLQDEAALAGVLDVLRVEVNEIDFESWYSLVRWTNRNACILQDGWCQPAYHPWVIEVEGSIGGQTYRSRFPITELTPRTFEAYSNAMHNRE